MSKCFYCDEGLKSLKISNIVGHHYCVHVQGGNQDHQLKVVGNEVYEIKETAINRPPIVIVLKKLYNKQVQMIHYM